MNKFLLTAAVVLAFAAPAFAEDVVTTTKAATVGDTTVKVEAIKTEGATAPAPIPAPSNDPVAQGDAKAKEACTTETNEKVKLPENAGDAEKAQWDAAFAECLKGKGVATEPKVDLNVDVKKDAPKTDEAAPAAE